MGRKLSFSKNEATEKAMHIFWRGGYDATSMRDIAAELNRPLASVYHSFGDKHQLYRTALDHYITQFIDPILENFNVHPRPNDALNDFFDMVIQSTCTNTIPSGCFLIQCASELKTSEPDLAARASEALEQLRLGFKNILVRMGKTEKLDDWSHYVLMVFIAIKTWARAHNDPVQLKNYAKLALAPLNNPSD